MNEIESGTLYLVPTPIGNLSDMTQRAISVLKNVDLIAAEDTRHSGILLNHFHISREIISYHEHNKKETGPKIIELLKKGKSVAQCSDAGMPVISDPGADLVRLALDSGIKVVPLPGPNAALTALIASGLDARQFLFIGFLPKITAKKKKLLSDIQYLPVTLIFYEAPHRLKETLAVLRNELGNRKAVLARELTKKFETFQRGSLDELLGTLEITSPRGEYVVLLDGISEELGIKEDKDMSWETAALELSETSSIKEAAREISRTYHLSRREVYQYLLNHKEAIE